MSERKFVQLFVTSDKARKAMFEVFKSEKNEQYYFHLKAGNGQIILASEGYTSKAMAVKGIESVRENAAEETNFSELVSSDDRWYFNLRAANNQVIGTSQMYSGKAGMVKGIHSVMNTAPDARIVDLTV